MIIWQSQPLIVLHSDILIKVNFIILGLHLNLQVRAVLSNPDESSPPFISIQTPRLPPSQEKPEETFEPQNPQKRRRKGIPHRAPFF